MKHLFVLQIFLDMFKYVVSSKHLCSAPLLNVSLLFLCNFYLALTHSIALEACKSIYICIDLNGMHDTWISPYRANTLLLRVNASYGGWDSSNQQLFLQESRVFTVSPFIFLSTLNNFSLSTENIPTTSYCHYRVNRRGQVLGFCLFVLLATLK